MYLHVFFRIFAIYMRRIGTIILGIFGIVSTCAAGMETDTKTDTCFNRFSARHFGCEVSVVARKSDSR